MNKEVVGRCDMEASLNRVEMFHHGLIPFQRSRKFMSYLKHEILGFVHHMRSYSERNFFRITDLWLRASYGCEERNDINKCNCTRQCEPSFRGCSKNISHDHTTSSLFQTVNVLFFKHKWKLSIIVKNDIIWLMKTFYLKFSAPYSFWMSVVSWQQWSRAWATTSLSPVYWRLRSKLSKCMFSGLCMTVD